MTEKSNENALQHIEEEVSLIDSDSDKERSFYDAPIIGSYIRHRSHLVKTPMTGSQDIFKTFEK